MKINQETIYTAMQALFMFYNAVVVPVAATKQEIITYESTENMNSLVEVAEIEECTLTQDIEEQLDVVITETAFVEGTPQNEESENLDYMWDLCTDSMDAIDLQKAEEKRRLEEGMEMAGQQENEYGY